MKMLSYCLSIIMSVVSFSVSGSTTQDATTVTLTKEEQQIVTSSAQKVNSEVRDKFEKLHEEWYEASRKDKEVSLSSSLYARTKLPQFKEMLDMGSEIIPLVVEKMMDRKYFFTQSLYEALMKNAQLSIGEDNQVISSSQDRAQFLARQWINLYGNDR